LCRAGAFERAAHQTAAFPSGQTFADQLIQSFKNKKVIAAAIVVIAAIIVLGQFTSAIENLDKFFRRVFIGQ